MTPLEQRTILVQLTIHQWYGKVSDSTIAYEVRLAKGAQSSEDRYEKMVVPRRYMRKIASCVSALRSTHNELTLPWQSDGVRILPSSQYFDYCSKINAGKADLSKAVEELITKLPEIIEEQKRTRGKLFCGDDYPTPDELRSSFGVDVRVLPFPSTTDFRLEGLDATELRKEIEGNISTSLAEAESEILLRFRNAIGRWVETLSDPERIFRDSMIENLQFLVDMAPHLNVTHSERVEELRAGAEKLLQYTPEQLRHDKVLRLQAYTEAGDLLWGVRDIKEAA